MSEVIYSDQELLGLSAHGSNVIYGSESPDEEEPAGRSIIDRIRQLEAVTFRDRQRQESRRLATACSDNDQVAEASEGNGSGAKNLNENKALGKRDSSHLVAKALGIDPDRKQQGGSGGGFYDCNICLQMAKEPVLTCCGHLFCWPCFYQLPCIMMDAKECPVCTGEVKDSTVIPVYGSGSSDDSHKTETSEYGMRVPARPRGNRVVSVRQRLYGREDIPVERIQQHFSSIIGIMESQEQPLFPGNRSQRSRVAEAISNRRRRNLRVSRLLGEGSEVQSSASDGALDSAAIIVPIAEAYPNDVDYVSYLSTIPVVSNSESSPLVSAGIQPESETPNSTSGSHRRNYRPSNINVLNLPADGPTDNNSTEPVSSSSRRRRSSSGVSGSGSRTRRPPRPPRHPNWRRAG